MGLQRGDLTVPCGGQEVQSMSMYVGLTNYPARRKQEHGNPTDWTVYGPFSTERGARAWERRVLASGYRGGSGGDGWQYGYTYTITRYTK